MKISRAVISYIETDKPAARKLLLLLHARGISARAYKRDEWNESASHGADMAISLGGDGTFLKTAKYLKSIPVLGVNSNSREKEGYFTSVDIEDAGKAIDAIQRGAFHVIKLNRVCYSINGKVQQYPALNEIYIGTEKAWHVAEYYIQLRGRKEFQRSSGVIISTPAGSTAWHKSACGASLPLSSKSFAFRVREPYFGRLNRPTLLEGKMGPKERLTLSCSHNCVAVADSRDVAPLKKGDAVEVMLSESRLNVISFHKKYIRWKW